MITLYRHQQKLVDQFPRRHALVWGTGTGKTLTLIYLSNKTNQRTLVICPKSIKKNWQLQMAEHSTVPEWQVWTKEEFRKWAPYPHDEDNNYQTVIIDECHYFLGMKSQMSKVLINYLKRYKVANVYAASATVFRSTPWNIYRLMQILGHEVPYKWFDSTFFDYFRMGMRMIPKPKRGIEDKLAQLVQSVGSVVKLEDCVDLPPQNFVTEYFELTDEQEEAIKDNFDPMPIVRFTKEHQICGGTLKGDDYTESKVIPSNKMERLVELAEENPRMIVMCRYNNEINVLAGRLKGSGKIVRIINGSVAGDERHWILEELGKKDEYVLLVNSSISAGWELPECPLMVFYSYSYSFVDFVQSLGRINRINRPKINTYVSLVVKDTIDQDIFETITVKKMDFQTAIYNEQGV